MYVYGTRSILKLGFASFDSFETLQPSDAPRIPLSDFERKVKTHRYHFAAWSESVWLRNSRLLRLANVARR